MKQLSHKKAAEPASHHGVEVLPALPPIIGEASQGSSCALSGTDPARPPKIA